MKKEIYILAYSVQHSNFFGADYDMSQNEHYITCNNHPQALKRKSKLESVTFDGKPLYYVTLNKVEIYSSLYAVLDKIQKRPVL
jgi:hypothetical protein